MAGTVAMEEAPAMKENSVSAAMRAGLFSQSTKGGRLLQGKAVGEGRRRDPLGVLAPNDTLGNRGSVEKTLDSTKNRVAQQHKSSESQLDLNSNLRHASVAPGYKTTFALSKPTASRNVLGTLAAKEPGPIASPHSNLSTFRPISPDKEAGVTLPDNQEILKDLELRYGNPVENRAVQKRSSPLQKRNEQHGLKWTKVTPQPRASTERERFRSPSSPAGSFQRLRGSASRVENANGAASHGKDSGAAERTESTNQKSPSTKSQLSPSIAALLHRIQNDLLDDSRGQRVRKSPRVSSGNLFKRRGTPRQHREFPSGSGVGMRKLVDRDQLSACNMGNASESSLSDEKPGADVSSAVSIEVSPSRPELRSEVSETDFTANPEVDGNKSTKLTGDCGVEDDLADRYQVRSFEETRLRARLKSTWEVTTRSRKDLSWSSASNLTYGSDVLIDNEIPKGSIGEMEISNGNSMLMTLEVTEASSHASSSTHCYSDNSLLQKTTAGKAFPSMPRRSSGTSTAITCGDGPKPCDDINSSLSTPQLTGNYSSPAHPFVMNSKKSPSSRPSSKVFPKRRSSKLGAPSRVLRTIASDETQSSCGGLSDAGVVAPVSNNDYSTQRLRQRDSISMQSGPVMETLSGSGLSVENGADAGRPGSPPWSGMRSAKEPKVMGVFGGENTFETAKFHTAFTGSRLEDSKTSLSVRSPECSLDADTEDGRKDAKQPNGATATAESKQPASIDVLPKTSLKEDAESAEIRPAVGNKLKVKSAATEAVRARVCDSGTSRSTGDNGLRGRPINMLEAVDRSFGRAPATLSRASHVVLNKLREPSGEGQAPREAASRSQLLSSTNRVRNTSSSTGEAGDSARRSETAGPRAAVQFGVLPARAKSTSDVLPDVEQLDRSISFKNLNGVTTRKPYLGEHEKDSKVRNGRQATLVTGSRERSGRGGASLRVAELGPKSESMDGATARDHVNMEQHEEKGGDATGMSVSDGLTSLSLEKTEMMEISHDELPSHDVVNSKTTASSSAALSCTVNSHSTNSQMQEKSQVSAPHLGPASSLQESFSEAQTSPEQDRSRKSNEVPIHSSGVSPRDPSPRVVEMPKAARSIPSEEKNAGVSAADSSETAKNVASLKPVAATASSKRITENSQFVWVNNKRYQKLGKIGKGGSSEVYKVIDSECNIYALKKISLKGREPSIARSFYQEIEYLETLRGKRNVVQLVAFEVTNTAVIAEDYQEKICDDACIYMVLEYGEIDLAGILSKKRKQMQESGDAVDDNWLRYFWELMLLAVKTIHDERIVHADLKPANFLLVKGELKLIDFGIAKAIQNDTTHIVRDSQVGTVNYMSPEAFMTNTIDEEGRKVKCGRSSDIWSLGCILYQMVYGHLPFSNIDSFYARIHAITSKDTKIDFPLVKNVWLLDCMKRCLTWDRYSRPHISDLLEHPLLRPENASQYTLIGK